MKKILIITAMAVNILIIFAIQAWGDSLSITKNIAVTYRQIKVYIDGQKIGGEEPFVMNQNGVLMVPARDVFSALGKNMSWDEATQAFYVGDQKSVIIDSASKHSRLEEMKIIRNVGPFYQQPDKSYLISGGAHRTGIAVKLAEGIKNPQELKEPDDVEAEIVIRTNGQYRGMEGWLGVDDETMNSRGGFILTVYADDFPIYKSVPVFPAAFPTLIRGKEINITGAVTVRLNVKWIPGKYDKSGTQESYPGDYCDLVAVLADFKLNK